MYVHIYIYIYLYKSVHKEENKNIPQINNGWQYRLPLTFLFLSCPVVLLFVLCQYVKYFVLTAKVLVCHSHRVLVHKLVSEWVSSKIAWHYWNTKHFVSFFVLMVPQTDLNCIDVLKDLFIVNEWIDDDGLYTAV